MSAKMLLGLLLATTFLQMKSDRVGSSSPMYSTIFLLTQGFILRSINVCRKIFNNSKTNINQKNTDDKQSTRIDMCSHKYTGFTIKAKRQHYSWAVSSIGKKELKWIHQNKQAADLIYGLQTRITQIFYKKLATELTNRPENKTKEVHRNSKRHFQRKWKTYCCSLDRPWTSPVCTQTVRLLRLEYVRSDS